MRNPDRIPEMLELLRKVWQRHPDLRLGQLVFNAARMSDAGIEDVFSVEDGSLRKGLIRYLEMTKAQETRPQDA